MYIYILYAYNYYMYINIFFFCLNFRISDVKIKTYGVEGIHRACEIVEVVQQCMF